MPARDRLQALAFERAFDALAGEVQPARLRLAVVEHGGALPDAVEAEAELLSLADGIVSDARRADHTVRDDDRRLADAVVNHVVITERPHAIGSRLAGDDEPQHFVTLFEKSCLAGRDHLRVVFRQELVLLAIEPALLEAHVKRLRRR